jgi:hypothetical protein
MVFVFEPQCDLNLLPFHFTFHCGKKTVNFPGDLVSNTGVRPEDCSEEAVGLELRFRAALAADLVADAPDAGW